MNINSNVRDDLSGLLSIGNLRIRSCFELRTVMRVKNKPDSPVLKASKCLECTINQDIRLSRH